MDYSKFIRRRLRNLGVRAPDAYHIGRWFAFQVRSQGPLRAIAFFKAVGDTIMNYHVGTPARPGWVATRHRYPKCVLRLKEYPLDLQLRVSKMARVIRLDEVQTCQVDKVVRGATLPYQGTESGSARLSQMINLGITTIGLNCLNRTVQAPVRPRHFAKTLIGRSMEDMERISAFVKALDFVLSVPWLRSLPYWFEVFYPLGRQFLDEYNERYTHPDDTDPIVGEIHATQEGAGKLRMFAAPNIAIQCLLYPIHDWIDERRRSIPNDCTYNQTAGALWAQKALRSGHTVYSVDLTTATCRFPLEPQLEALRIMGLDSVFIDAIRFVSRGRWKVGSELLPLFPSEIVWTVGQPLGIAPSMSMFSMCHSLLLLGICRMLRVHPDCFRVLGDDVVITSEPVHDAYLDILSDAGVPISSTKSHISDKFAEFAGYAILADTLLRPGQWRKAVAHNHLSLVTEIGRPLVGEVPDEFIKVERLHLFSLGLFDPKPHEWNLYLKALTKYTWRDINPIHGSLYEKWVRRLIRKGFMDTPSGFDFYPDFEPLPSDHAVLEFVLQPLLTVDIKTVRYAVSTARACLGIHTIESIFRVLWASLETIRNVDDPAFRSAVPAIMDVRDRIKNLYAIPASRSPFSKGDWQLHQAYTKVLAC